MKNVFLLFFVMLIWLGITNGSTIDDLRARISSSNSAKERLESIINLAKVCKYVNIDSALYLCDKAYPLAVLNKSTSSEADILILRSEINRRKGNYDQAMELAVLARDKALKIDDKRLYANALLAQGGIYLELLALDLAYECYMSALSIFGSMGDTTGECWSYSNLGALMSIQKQYKESLSYFKKAEKSMDKLDDVVLKAALFNNIGTYYYNQDSIELANKYIRESLKICEDEDLTMLIIYNYANLSLLYLREDDFGKAIESLKTVENIANNSGSKYELGKAKYGIGWIYYQMNDLDSAMKYLSQTYLISKEIGAIDLMQMSLGTIAPIYHKLGNIDSAYFYSNLHNIFTDSLNLINNRHSIMKLKYEYDYQREKQQLLWKGRFRNIIIVVLFVIISLIIFSVIIILKRHKLKLENMELEKVRLKDELEHKSREMTTKLIYLQKKNDLISSIADQLLKLKPQMKVQNQGIIDNIIHTLKNNADSDNWKEFELRFEEVHGGFMKKLTEQFPDLTTNEKRLCAYLRLNMTTKEIASLLYLSVHSVDSARYRLRKKLNLTNSDTDISTFLEQF